MGPTAAKIDRAADATLAVVSDLFGPEDSWPLRLRLWDGREYGPRADLSATVVLNTPSALRAMLWPPSDLSAGEAYIYGDFDVEGDLEQALSTLDTLDGGAILSSPARLARIATRLRQLPAPEPRDPGRSAEPSGSRHSQYRDRSAVRYHYDVSNEFYATWLDRRMQYSCGYFTELNASLDEAQEAKLEHICRKLGLAQGDRLLDIGCGWGGLAEYAADRYGAHVVGITLSEPQAELASERLARAGLSDRTRIDVCDYRDVAGRFDKVVSVGMAEHVGEDKLEEYFGVAMRVLEPGGVFLNHAIGCPPSQRTVPAKDGFVHRYVFPDGELVPISRMLAAAEAAGFEVRDVENLREHYAQTLRHWVANLERRRDETQLWVDEVTYRIWKLYMAGSAHGFHTGSLNVFQTLLHKRSGTTSGLPLTRAQWYQDA